MKNRNIIYSIIGVVTLWFVSCSTKTPSARLTETNKSKQLVARQFEKWKNGEESFFELLDKDVIWTVSGRSPVSGIYHGKDDFLENAVKPITERFTTPLKPELISLSCDEDYVWLHFKAQAGTVKGQLYENTYVWKMQLKNNRIVSGVAFLDTYELSELMTSDKRETMEENNKYVGMWVSADGYIRHELLPEGRYDEARGSRKSAYRGSYTVSGNHIDYVDDTGFTADGEFTDEKTLHHGGYIFYKEE